MKNYFGERQPWVAAFYLLIMLVFVMAEAYGPGQCFFFAALSIYSIYLHGIRAYGKNLCRYGAVVLFFVVFNTIFNHRGETPFLYVNDAPLTVESAAYGMYTGIMVCTLFLWFRIFQDIFDNQKITYLIGSRLPVVGLILGMVFCYYDRFLKKLPKIQEVWHCYGTEKTLGPWKHAGVLLSVLLSVMLEDSVDTALSMKARGYGGGKRTSYVRYPFEWADGVFLMVSAVALGLLFLRDTPGMAYLKCVYFLMPVLFNFGKELQWKYYQLKI